MHLVYQILIRLPTPEKGLQCIEKRGQYSVLPGEKHVQGNLDHHARSHRTGFDGCIFCYHYASEKVPCCVRGRTGLQLVHEQTLTLQIPSCLAKSVDRPGHSVRVVTFLSHLESFCGHRVGDRFHDRVHFDIGKRAVERLENEMKRIRHATFLLKLVEEIDMPQ